jgi:rRNA maturation RNase YbeY
MTFMAVHGLLHVLGFDHYDDEGLAEMQNAERELMGRWTAAEREE